MPRWTSFSNGPHPIDPGRLLLSAFRRIVDIMGTRSRLAVATLACGVAGAALVGAPPALASGADAVINDLQSKGYLVQINYVNGASKPLPLCTVTNVNNPSSSPPKPGDTVYVDVTCPNHEDDGGGGGVGFGVGIG
jgi:hypothetical protein